jgi:hypothetical protein
MCGLQTQLTTSLFLKTSLHVSAPTGHLQVITIVKTFNTCCFEDSHLLQYIHYIHDYKAYLLLLNLYLYNIGEVLNIQLFT